MEEIQVEPNKYVIAVSGGVDSMALLDILSKKPGVELVVAHFNHGIRPDSAKDEKLVAGATKKYNLKLEVGRGHLGKGASEATARQARYAFLNQAKGKHRAKAVITAHHQDDLIETAFLNILRGTGPRGLTAIKSNPAVVRPFLGVTKKEIEDYAKRQSLRWREDSTNINESYLRNYLRLHVIPQLSAEKRNDLLSKIENVANNQVEKNELIATISQNISTKYTIRRADFINLPQEVGKEVVKYWFERLKMQDIGRDTIQKVSLGIKTAKPHSRLSVRRGMWLNFGPKKAYFSEDNPENKLPLS